MKLNVEELAREAGGVPINGRPKEIAIVGSQSIESFASLIVERCAVTAGSAVDSGWDGATVATIIRNLLEDK